MSNRCNNSTSKYCCPKCNKYYCSLSCYQSEKHVQCSESFYEECVEQEIKNRAVDKKSANEIAKALNELMYNGEETQDNHNVLDSDEEVCPNLAERLASCNLDDTYSVWNSLTNDEHEEFRSLVDSGEIYKLVPKWKPWWEKVDKKNLVEEVSENDPKNSCEYPTIKNKIINIDILTSHNPASNVKYNIVNVLSAYTVTVRYFNGDYLENCTEAADYLIKISKNLYDNSNYNSVSEAINSVAKSINDKNEKVSN